MYNLKIKRTNLKLLLFSFAAHFQFGPESWVLLVIFSWLWTGNTLKKQFSIILAILNDIIVFPSEIYKLWSGFRESVKTLGNVGRRGIVDKSSGYSAKGPRFKTRWRQKSFQWKRFFKNQNCRLYGFNSANGQLGKW